MQVWKGSIRVIRSLSDEILAMYNLKCYFRCHEEEITFREDEVLIIIIQGEIKEINAQ